MHLFRTSHLAALGAAAAFVLLAGCASDVRQLERQRERMISHWHKSNAEPQDWNRAGLISAILKLDRDIAELESRRDYVLADRLFDPPKWFGKVSREVSDFSTSQMVSFYPVKVRFTPHAGAAPERGR